MSTSKFMVACAVGATVLCSSGAWMSEAYADTSSDGSVTTTMIDPTNVDPLPVDDPSGTPVDVDGPSPVTSDPGDPDVGTPVQPDSTVSPDIALCADKDYKKYRVSSKTTQFLAKTPTFVLTNNGNVTATHTFAAGISASLALSVSASVTTEASVIVAGVKASGTVGATASISVSGTYSVTGSARPHTTAYMQIGFYRVKTGGTYTYYSRYCSIAPKSYSATAYTPYRFGGRVWGG